MFDVRKPFSLFAEDVNLTSLSACGSSEELRTPRVQCSEAIRLDA